MTLDYCAEIFVEYFIFPTAKIVVEYIIVPSTVIYYSFVRSRSFHNSKYLAQYLNHMTWFKILQLKYILDRKDEIKDFDNVQIQTLYGCSGIRRIGFFKDKTHVVSVYSTETWPCLTVENISFDLKPRHPFSRGSAIYDQKLWFSAGNVL